MGDYAWGVWMQKDRLDKKYGTAIVIGMKEDTGGLGRTLSGSDPCAEARM